MTNTKIQEASEAPTVKMYFATERDMEEYQSALSHFTILQMEQLISQACEIKNLWQFLCDAECYVEGDE